LLDANRHLRVSEEGNMSVWQRSVPTIVLPLVIGLIVLVPMIRDSRLGTLHPVDVAKLVSVGMCFGVALTAIVFWLRTSGSR
jgi:hypothetical protein